MSRGNGSRTALQTHHLWNSSRKSEKERRKRPSQAPGAAPLTSNSLAGSLLSFTNVPACLQEQNLVTELIFDYKGTAVRLRKIHLLESLCLVMGCSAHMCSNSSAKRKTIWKGMLFLRAPCWNSCHCRSYYCNKK